MKPTAINCCRAHSLTHSLTHSWTQLRRLHSLHYTTPPSDSALSPFNFSYENSIIASQDDSQVKPTLSSCKYTALIRPLDALYTLAVLAWLTHFLFPFPFVLRGQVFQSIPVIQCPCRGTDSSPLDTDFLIHWPLFMHHPPKSNLRTTIMEPLCSIVSKRAPTVWTTKHQRCDRYSFVTAYSRLNCSTINFSYSYCYIRA